MDGFACDKNYPLWLLQSDLHSSQSTVYARSGWLSYSPLVGFDQERTGQSFQKQRPRPMWLRPESIHKVYVLDFWRWRFAASDHQRAVVLFRRTKIYRKINFNSIITWVSNLSAIFKIDSWAEAIFVDCSIASSTSSTSNGPYIMFFLMLRANRTGSCWTTVTKRCKLVIVFNFQIQKRRSEYSFFRKIKQIPFVRILSNVDAIQSGLGTLYWLKPWLRVLFPV